MMPNRIHLSLLLVLALLGFSGRTHAAEPLPAKLQAIILQKILFLNRTLEGKKINLVIADSDGRGADLESALGGGQVRVKRVSLKELPSALDGASVVYFFEAPSAEIKHALAQRKILSIGGNVRLVEAGDVAVATGLEEKKPTIFIHLKRLKAEGHELASDLLALAKVIR